MSDEAPLASTAEQRAEQTQSESGLISRRSLKRVRLPSNRVLLIVGLAALALVVRMIRINAAPDELSDELYYTSVVRHFAATGTLKDFLGVHIIGNFFTDPPLYFLVAALFEKITGNAELRYLSAFLGGVATLQVFFLGKAMVNRRVGVVASILFALSPIAIRFERMNMIESVGVVALLAFVQCLWRALSGRSWILASGVALGAVLLTKEILVFAVIVLVLVAVANRPRLPVSSVVTVLAIAAGMYSLYVLWSCLVDASGFFAVKELSVERALGLKVTTGYALPRFPSPFADIEGRGGDLVTDIIIGIFAAIGLLPAIRRRSPPELLAGAWLYVTVAFLLADRIYNFQFTEYLVPPAVLGAGIVFNRLLPKYQRKHCPCSVRGLRSRGNITWCALLVVIVVWDMADFSYRYIATTDRGMWNAAAWITKNLPADVPIYAPLDFYWLTPDRTVVQPYLYPTLASAQPFDVSWVVISPRTAYMLAPDTYRCVEQTGKRVALFPGITSRGVSIIHMPHPLSPSCVR